MLDLLIYTCAHRHIDAGTVSAMEIFRLNSKINYLWLTLTGDALIGRARSICLTNFWKNWKAGRASAAPYMMFLDDDIIFKPDDINRLYRDLKAGNDLVGGAYPVKDGTELASSGYGEETPFDGKLIDCRLLATGFMGISAKLIDRMINELKSTRWSIKPDNKEPQNIPLLHKGMWCETYPFFENIGVSDHLYGSIWLSEDYDFCEKAHSIGVMPKLDTGIQLSHVGLKVYSFNDVVLSHARKKESNAKANI